MRQAIARAPAPPRAVLARARLPAGRSRHDHVLALQRTIGNAATRRLLLRTPRQPYEHQWENPALVETIYPGREKVLRKFVSIFREIELGDVTDPGERRRRSDAEVDALSGEDLMAEVQRLFGSGAVPDWLEPLVLDYAGMRYAIAHGSYYSPVRLLHFVEKSAVDMSPEDAIARLEAMHDAGEIPEWAWHKIVRLTELRTYYADADWEDTSAETPGDGPKDALWIGALAKWTSKDPKVKGLSAGTTGWRSEVRRRNEILTTRMVCDQLSEVTQLQRGVVLDGGISKNARQFVRAALGHNGNKPVPGAVFKQAPRFEDLKPGAVLFWIDDTHWATEKPNDANLVYAIPGVTDYPMPPPPDYVAEWKAWRDSDDGKTWRKAERAYKRELKAYEKRLKKAKKAAAKAGTTFDLASVGDAPSKPVSTEPRYMEDELLPSDRESNGFTYTVTLGQPISRTDGRFTHWLRWRHQATVVKAMSRSRIITWETTDMLPGDDDLKVSGFRERTAESLQDPGVFLGYLPGTVDPVVPAAEDGAVAIPDVVEDLFKTMLESF